MLFNTRELTKLQVNFAVAIAEGIAVVEHKGHCAQELPFSPEGPAHDFHPQHKCMWRFYEPTDDWDIAGPIIFRERISINFSDPDEEEEEYCWARFKHLEVDATLPTEAAMRAYVIHVFGETIDFDAPRKKRIARVKLNGMKSLDEDVFVDDVVNVLAATTVEAEQLGREHPSMAGFISCDAYFMGWEPKPVEST